MSGWVAGAGLAGSVLATGASLYTANQRQGSERGQLDQARENYTMQNAAMAR